MSLELKIDRVLTLLTRQEKEKNKWVSATWIQELTGWDGERLRQAREDKIIECKKVRPKVYKYLLSSLPQQFIKLQTVS